MPLPRWCWYARQMGGKTAIVLGLVAGIVVGGLIVGGLVAFLPGTPVATLAPTTIKIGRAHV